MTLKVCSATPLAADKYSAVSSITTPCFAAHIHHNKQSNSLSQQIFFNFFLICLSADAVTFGAELKAEYEV